MARCRLALMAALFVAIGSVGAQAQQPAAGDGVSPGEAISVTSNAKIPDDFKLNILIRSTVIAVNQANKTNNYAVLRGLGSPRFQEANSAEKLGEIFEALRSTKFDLSPVLFFTPKLLQAPSLDGGMLRLTGFFDTAPQRVSFDMLFEDVKGEWLLFGLNIATQPSPALGARETSPTAPAPQPHDLQRK